MDDDERASDSEIWSLRRDALSLLATAGELLNHSQDTSDLSLRLRMQREAICLEMEAVQMLKASDYLLTKVVREERAEIAKQKTLLITPKRPQH